MSAPLGAEFHQPLAPRLLPVWRVPRMGTAAAPRRCSLISMRGFDPTPHPLLGWGVLTRYSPPPHQYCITMGRGGEDCSVECGFALSPILG